MAIRTPGLRFRRASLYPAELYPHLLIFYYKRPPLAQEFDLLFRRRLHSPAVLRGHFLFNFITFWPLTHNSQETAALSTELRRHIFYSIFTFFAHSLLTFGRRMLYPTELLGHIMILTQFCKINDCFYMVFFKHLLII